MSFRSRVVQSSVVSIKCRLIKCRSISCRRTVLNDTLRIVTGCLRPTPTDHSPILSGIQPAELHQLKATHSLTYRGSLDPDHILYDLLSGSSHARQERLKSRLPFVPAPQNVLNNLAGLRVNNPQMEPGVL